MLSLLFTCSYRKDIRYLRCSIYRRQHSRKASMKKMSILTTTLLFGVHGGRIINGVTSAASKQFGTPFAQVLLELRQLRLQQIK